MLNHVVLAVIVSVSKVSFGDLNLQQKVCLFNRINKT
jgi:hypothetical protein